VRRAVRRTSKPPAKPAARRVTRRPRKSSMTMAALMREAVKARGRAYAPYSRFPVGAALLLADGSVVHGSNVENASYGLAACAERTAMWKAVTEGRKGFVAIAITAREGEGAPPCGSCRQVLHEFAPHLRVVWRNAAGRLQERPLHELLPNAFRFARKTTRRKTGGA
jgi:cytidine deaminase